MKYFYDTEFLEGTQKSFFGQSKPTIDLISIGIVAEDGREYYAISKDFNLKEAWNRFDLITNEYTKGFGYEKEYETEKVYWIRENLLKPIYYDWVGKDVNFHEVEHFTYKNFKRLLKKYGKTNKQIAQELKHFIYEKEDVLYNKQEIDFDSVGDVKSKIQLYGYYSAYDHVALCWLFGKMIDLPKGFPMYTIDLKQILDEKPLVFKPTVIYNDGKYVGGIDPYYASWKEHVNYPKQNNEHNALADAKWNYELYKFIKTL